MKTEINKSQDRADIERELESYFSDHSYEEALELRDEILPKNASAKAINSKLGLYRKEGPTWEEERNSRSIILIFVGEAIKDILERQNSGLVDKELFYRASDLIWLLNNVHYDTDKLYSIIGKIFFNEANKLIDDIDLPNITDSEITHIETLLRKAADGSVNTDTLRKKFHLMVTKKRVSRAMDEG